MMIDTFNLAPEHLAALTLGLAEGVEAAAERLVTELARVRAEAGMDDETFDAHVAGGFPAIVALASAIVDASEQLNAAAKMLRQVAGRGVVRMNADE